jgi:hypothetical protein
VKLQYESKFVKPRTRIPPQQPAKSPSFAETLGYSKNRISLKEFLAAPCPSKRVRTAIWNTSLARGYDSNSYIKASRTRTLITENKRKRKEMFKQLREQMERQRYAQKREHFEEQQPTRGHFASVHETPSHLYSKPKEVVLEKLALSKGSTEATPISKGHVENASRAFEEAEHGSTAISCYERVPARETFGRAYQDSHYNEYPIDHDINPGVHQVQERDDRIHLSNNKSLLDELFEANNQAYNEEFMDSISY